MTRSARAGSCSSMLRLASTRSGPMHIVHGDPGVSKDQVARLFDQARMGAAVSRLSAEAIPASSIPARGRSPLVNAAYYVRDVWLNGPNTDAVVIAARRLVAGKRIHRRTRCAATSAACDESGLTQSVRLSSVRAMAKETGAAEVQAASGGESPWTRLQYQILKRIRARRTDPNERQRLCEQEQAPSSVRCPAPGGGSRTGHP